jgi:ATP-binding cassette, subfamily B, bacterial
MAKDYANLHQRLVLTYFWKVIRNYKVSFFVTIACQVLASILDVYIPYQYLQLWKALTVFNADNFHTGKLIIFFILGLNLVRWVIRRLSTFSNDYFQASVMAGLREQGFSYMIGHSNAFFANNFGGSLVQKVNKYARAFEKLMERFTSDALPLVIRVVGTVTVLYILAPVYSYILAGFCCVFVTTTYFVSKWKLKYDVVASEADTKTTGVLADAIGNHSSIQLFTGHAYERTSIGGVIEKQRTATVFNWYLWDSLFSVQSFYAVITEFIIFWVALGEWARGIIQLPIFILLQAYLLRLIDSLWSVGGLIRTYYDGFADAQEMALILDMPYDIADKKNVSTLTNVAGTVDFNHVTYIYDKTETKVLDDFSLHIPAGQKVALVGSSGAGKSTFVRLIM